MTTLFFSPNQNLYQNFVVLNFFSVFTRLLVVCTTLLVVCTSGLLGGQRCRVWGKEGSSWEGAQWPTGWGAVGVLVLCPVACVLCIGFSLTTCSLISCCDLPCPC